MNDIEIDFSMYSGVPVIEPKIWSNNGSKYKSCFLLFDTGACMTAMSVVLADSLGYKRVRNKSSQAGSIGGSKFARYAVIPDIKIGNFSFGPIAAWVIDFEESLTTNLILGMNVIKHFNTSITFHENSYSKGSIKMYPRFNICDIKSLNDFDIDYSMFGIYNLIV